MSSVSHNYDVGDTVYYISSNSLKTGVVLKVSISITSSGTTINYVLRVGSNSQTVEESVLYGNCKAEGGYQDAVFTSSLSTSTVVIPSGSVYAGMTLTGAVIVDNGVPIALSYSVPGSPVTSAVTVQDILNNLNNSLTPYADATIYQNKIRIRSRSTGASSTVVINDGGSPLGSPLPNKYFDSMTKFTGLSSSVDGVGDGALEALSSTVC